MTRTRGALLLVVLVSACSSRQLTQPSPSPSPPLATTDAPVAVVSPWPDPLIALVRGCTAECRVDATLTLPLGRRAALVADPEGLHSTVLLLRGGRLLHAYPFDSYGGELRTDRTGNILVLEQGNTAQCVQPLVVRRDHLFPLSGFTKACRMFGDNGTRFQRRAGVLDIVMHRHALAVNQLPSATVTWRWNGSTYVEGPCRDESTGRRGGAACE